MSFLDGSMGKKSACNAGDIGDSGSIPGWGRFPRGGNGNPFQYSSLGNSMHRGTWQAIVHGATRVRHDWLTGHSRAQLFNSSTQDTYDMGGSFSAVITFCHFLLAMEFSREEY